MKKDEFIEKLTHMTREEITEFLLSKGKVKKPREPYFEWDLSGLKK